MPSFVTPGPLRCAVASALFLVVAATGGGGRGADLGTDRDAFTPASTVVAPGTILSEG